MGTTSDEHHERQLLCGLCAGRLLLGEVPLVKQVRRRGSEAGVASGRIGGNAERLFRLGSAGFLCRGLYESRSTRSGR